jgi:hypothetical protein
VQPPTELELELIQTQMTQKPMLRAEVGVCVAQTKQVLNNSRGGGALAKSLAESEVFVGVAHSAGQ